MNSHEIDFELFGNNLQCIEIELDPNETVIAEAGSMMMMNQSIEMNTILGDGSNQDESVLGQVFSASKRVLTGESLFTTTYTQRGSSKAKGTFAALCPGKIIPLNLLAFGGKIICQKEAFLCAAKGVSVSIEFQRKLGVGFFSGEGFIMQKLEGDGLAFLHGGGTVVKRCLTHGEVLNVDTGCLVALSSSVDYDIRLQKGIKNSLFGGEGLFIATLQGPGDVWIQSMPFSRLADRIYANMPRTGRKRTDEGSILGRIGSLLDDDK